LKSAQSTYRESCGDQQEMDAVVLKELPQVYYVAARIGERLPRHVEMQDLVQAGIVGLLEACRTYDPAKDAQFSTFAKFRIRGAILDSLRKLDWGSRAVRKKGREIDAAATRLESALGRQPSEEEIARELNIGLAELQALRCEIDSLYLLGQQVESHFESGDVRDLIESAPASGKENPFELCADGERRELLAKAIAELDEREQTILSLYYREELTMKEIAEVIGFAQSRVSQIHAVALAKLRRRLGCLKPVHKAPRQTQAPIHHSKPNATGRRAYECIA